MSNVHRLRTTDRIFFVAVNPRRRAEPFTASEYGLMIDALEGSRRRQGFLLCGYVLMPDHWHALIWAAYPLTISQVIHEAKRVATVSAFLTVGFWDIVLADVSCSPAAHFGPHFLRDGESSAEGRGP